MTHIYQPLPNKDATRLLVIQPGLPDEPLRCYLVICDSLETAPPYEALSYVWGPKEPSQQILLNEEVKSIRPNLYDALLRLRPRPSQPERDEADMTKDQKQCYLDVSHLGISDGLVWIDALCINQDNNVERGQQVVMMSSIYRRAKQVIIWLGKYDEHIPQSMPMLGKVASLYSPTDDERGVRTWSPWNDAMAESYGLPTFNSPEWSCVNQFLCIPWFTRIWVLQELLLASNVRMYIGRYRIKHEILDNATHNIYRFLQDHFKEKAATGLAGLDVMFKYPDIQKIKHYEAPVLGRLLQRCRVMDSGDPRDKVFALLSMSAIGQGPSLPKKLYPDYSKTRFEVYRDAAHYVLGAEQTLKYLVFSTSAWSEDKPSSWVFDIDMKFEDQQHDDLPWQHKASGQNPFVHEESDNGNELLVQGYRIDRVMRVLDDLTPVKQENLPNVWHTIMAAQESCFRQGIDAVSVFKALLATWVPWLENTWYGKGRIRKDLQDDLEHLWPALEARDGSALPTALNDDLRSAFRWSFGRRFFQTEAGRTGLGLPRLEVGDDIVVLHGGPVLYALRRDSAWYRFVGDCSMEGLMAGERVKQAEKDHESPTLFVLR